MESLWRVLLLLAVLNFAVAQDKPTFVKNGGKVTLELRPKPTAPITSILWKFKGDLLAEWEKVHVPLDYYNPFKGRADLDITNGSLTIDGLSESDSGEYSVEVNNLVQSKTYSVRVIEEVSKPMVEVKPLICGPALDQCKLTCLTNTKGAEPVTYSWKVDNEDWKESGKEFPITKAEHSRVKTFTCRAENPVGGKDSEPKNNPIYSDIKEDDSGNTGAVVGGVVGGLVAVVLGAVGYLFKTKKWPFNNRATDSFNLAENGDARKEEPPSSPRPPPSPQPPPPSSPQSPPSPQLPPPSSPQPPPSTTENSNNGADPEKEPLNPAVEPKDEND